MEIREATEADIPEIVALLKLSLGESLMPKSEQFWRWKHLENPFGPSPVLLCWDGKLLVGVRAFLRWEWKRGDRVYKAVRAVDTATHPEYQGKGIFKKLTLQLVDHCKKEGADFIFNTPNKSSKPGYLKMGWEEFGRLSIFLQPVLSFKKKAKDFDSCYQIDPELMAQWGLSNDLILQKDYLTTNYSAKFIGWRYIQSPGIRYYSFQDPSNTYLVLFRLKARRSGTEFRICDLFLKSTGMENHFKRHLFQAAKDAAASVITYSGNAFPIASLRLNLGPMVTVRPLQNSLSLSLWKPSIGDMEVF